MESEVAFEEMTTFDRAVEVVLEPDHDGHRRAKGEVRFCELGRPVLEQELKNSFKPVRNVHPGYWLLATGD